MIAGLKGAVVAAACCVLVAFQLAASPELEYYNDLPNLPLWLMGLGILTIPAGVGLGFLARALRSNRLLILVGAALALVMFAHVAASGHPPSERAANAIVLRAYLWAAIAGAVLSWWARPAPIEPVPAARWTRRIWFSRPRWRRPTVIELAVGIAITCALVCTVGVLDRSHQPEFSPWSKHIALVDGSKQWLVAAVLVAIAIPCGVTLGLLWTLTRSIVVVVIAAFVCGLIAAAYVSLLGPVEFPGWALGVVAVSGMAIAQAGNATSRDAGSTSTTP